METTSTQPAWHDVELPHSPVATRRTCDLIRHDLATLPLPPAVLDDALIVAGELVHNAIEHGHARDDGTICLGWSLEATRLLLRVIDAGVGDEITVAEVSADGLHGRGLAMVAAICDDWSIRRCADTTVTASIPLPQAPR